MSMSLKKPKKITNKKTLNQDDIANRKATALAHVTVWNVLGNENRLRILFMLCDSTQSWSDLMYTLKINPRSLSAHLRYLQQNEIVAKNGKDYSLTEFGNRICELNFFNPKYLEL